MSESLFQGYAEQLRSQGYWLKDDFISGELRTTLLDMAKSLYHHNEFTPAKVGKGSRKKRMKDIRGDFIHWIDDWEEPALQEILHLNEEIFNFSRRELFLPLKRFESHMAVYPAGARYLKHVDRHQLNPSRLISAVIYIGDWKAGGGGELVIYPGESASPVVIEPVPCRVVIFDSNLVHEVKTTKKSRWSLTTWFRDDVSPVIKL